jgi:tight adherence protein B
LLPVSFGLGGLGGLGLLITAGPVPVIGAAAAAYAVRARRVRAVRARVAARREAVVELTAALVAELRGGRAPSGAFAAAASGLPPGELRAELAAAAAAAEAGTDFIPLVAGVAGQAGGAGLRRVAACLRLSLAGGAGLAPALELVAAGLRDEEAVRREIAAQLAGPRATARLLAVLPVFGLVLGTGLGAEPVSLLVGTPLGLAALGTGTSLAIAGWLWTDRLARGVEALA